MMLSKESQQDILDRTTAAIVAQGGPSTDGGAGCLYRAPNGRRCAIGHLILDEHYSSALEEEAVELDPGSPVSVALRKSLGLESDLDGDSTNFLALLQEAHDDAAIPSKFKLRTLGDRKFMFRWRQRLEELCEGFELQFPEELFE